MLVIVLFNVRVVINMLCNLIISNKFNLELDVDDLICFNVHLFSAESPSHR